MRMLIFSLVLLVASFCFAGESVVIDPSLAEKPVDLIIFVISNWAAMSLVARGVAIVMLGTTLAVKFFPENPYKRVIVTLFGAANGVLIAISEGAPWWKALIVGLVSSGSAVAIFEAFKGIKKVVK